MYKVYKVTNILNNKSYIGMTKQSLDKRFSQHKQAAKRGVKTLLYNAIRKYGTNNFIIELISEHSNKKECINQEIYHISKNINGYNIASGGEGGFVVQNIEEWKQKLSKSRKGRTPAVGLKHSNVVKKVCREASIKYWKTQNTYTWEEIKNYSYKEAKEKFGISITHYYRLKKQNGEKALDRSTAAKEGWETLRLKKQQLESNELK